MEIKHEKGIVTFRMRAGKDLVRNTMPIGIAKSILARSKETKEIDGGVWVDNKYLFPIVRKKKSKQKEVEEMTTTSVTKDGEGNKDE